MIHSDVATSKTQVRNASRTVADARYGNIIVVTRKTQLEELLVRFNTVAQVRFYLEHAGQTFAPIEAAHARYHETLSHVRTTLPRGMKNQVIDRDFIPQFTFGEQDLVVTVGPDGLVVNVAKYLGKQPILSVNPDPASIEGVLLSYSGKNFAKGLNRTLSGATRIRGVTMAQTELNDEQQLLAFNDFFVGANSHVSARYHIRQGDQAEEQSSSGIIVSTGAGSTGWLRSVYAGATRVIEALGGEVVPPKDGGQFEWDADHLIYAVREPWPSKTTKANMVYGVITRDEPLVLESHMANNGFIFSDGIEADYLPFNAGTTATIGLADHKARLVQ